MKDSTPCLNLTAIRLCAGDRLLATNLDWQLRDGEVWGLLGPNGAGKSTLLRTMAGLAPPAAGSIFLNGRPLHEYAPRDLARRRAYLPQTLQDAFTSSTLEEVLIARYPHCGSWGLRRPADYAAAEDALMSVGLNGYADRLLDSLSGGERRRVGIAAALAQDTDLLLLDEPLAALDLQAQILVLSQFQRLAREQGKIIVYSLHDPNLAYRYTSHCILFRGHGRLQHGPTSEVLSAESLSQVFGHPITAYPTQQGPVFMAAPPPLETLGP